MTYLIHTFAPNCGLDQELTDALCWGENGNMHSPFSAIFQRRFFNSHTRIDSCVYILFIQISVDRALRFGPPFTSPDQYNERIASYFCFSVAKIKNI